VVFLGGRNKQCASNHQQGRISRAKMCVCAKVLGAGCVLPKTMGEGLERGWGPGHSRSPVCHLRGHQVWQVSWLWWCAICGRRLVAVKLVAPCMFDHKCKHLLRMG
jgi:hypothetical protein